MAINSYFRGASVGYESEQCLVESMNIEAIQITGVDVAYIPRTLNKLDRIFGEDVLSSFESYATIEMYISDFSGYGGESEVLSRFGMEIRDTASFIVARKRYVEEVAPIVPINRNDRIKLRPCEGDLIFVPNTKSLFEIKFVEDEEPGWYQLNKKYVWTLRCELVILNNETFKTGESTVDEQYGTLGNRLSLSILNEDGSHMLTETGGYVLSEDYEVSKEYDDMRSFGDNEEFKKEFLKIMDFSANDPFGGQ